MTVETDKGIIENVTEIQWYGCDMYVRKGKELIIVSEPKNIFITQ